LRVKKKQIVFVIRMMAVPVILPDFVQNVCRERRGSLAGCENGW
jgi:hypothetical protein